MLCQNRKKNVLSIEAYKYPYCGTLDDTENYLSNKICCYTIRTRKKIVRKTKRVFVYGQLILSLGNGLAPTQAIGLPILPNTAPITRSIYSNVGLSKKAIIDQIIKEIPAGIDFTEKEINQLYNLSIECRANSLSKEQLITEISNLRGGDLVNIVGALEIIGAIIIMLLNDWGSAFQPPVPPHLEWLCGPQSATGRDMTQNSDSEKKDPLSICRDYDYGNIMRELNKHSNKKIITIQVVDQIYTIKNPYCDDAYDLSDKLAGLMYGSIRKSDMDISDIAENLGYKADNIKNVKDHVFHQKHVLDKYVSLGLEAEYKRFDPYIHQALAWKRLEAGTHTQDDITWIKHECVERHHELKYGSGYSEAHNRAQTRFDGAPWDNNF